MQVRMSDEETKLVHELVQDALFDEVKKSKVLEEETVDPKNQTNFMHQLQSKQRMHEVMLEKLEKKLR